MKKEDKKENKELKELKEKKEKIEYKLTHEECGCTLDDFMNSLRFLPKNVLLSMIEEGSIEATCENCGTEYKIEGKDLDKVKEIAENSTTISGCNLTCCDGCPGCDLE